MSASPKGVYDFTLTIDLVDHPSVSKTSDTFSVTLYEVTNTIMDD